MAHYAKLLIQYDGHETELNRPSLREIGDTLAEFLGDIFIFYGHGDTQWEDLCQPAFSIPIPPPVIKLCSYLSHPKRRIWTSVGVSLLASILALSLQSTPPIVELKNWAIERNHQSGS